MKTLQSFLSFVKQFCIFYRGARSANKFVKTPSFLRKPSGWELAGNLERR